MEKSAQEDERAWVRQNYFKSDTVTLMGILPPSNTNVHGDRDTTSIRLTKGQGREARQHPCPSEEHGGEVGWVLDEDGAGCASDSRGKRNVVSHRLASSRRTHP